MKPLREATVGGILERIGPVSQALWSRTTRRMRVFGSVIVFL